jgi:ABC-2 type transport system ATP-binding protein
MPPPVIAFENVTMRYRAWRKPPQMAVQNVTLEVPVGEIFGFLGPNGAGKTTTIHLLMDFFCPTSGGLWLNGKPARNPHSRDGVGFLPELASYHRFLTPRQLLWYYADLLPNRRFRCAAEVQNCLELVGLGDDADKKIGRFSKGMLRKVGLAQAFFGEPRLLVLDEPTADLDPLMRKQVRELLLEFKARGGTVFLSSHLLGEVEATCDRVAILHRGQLRAVGTLDEIVGGPDRVEIQAAPLTDAAETLIQPLLAEPLAPRREGGCQIVIARADKNRVIDILRTHNVEIFSLVPHRVTLETAFERIVQS